MELTPGSVRPVHSRRFDLVFTGGGQQLRIESDGGAALHIELTDPRPGTTVDWLIDNGESAGARRLAFDLERVDRATSRLEFTVLDLGYATQASSFSWSMRGAGDEYYVRGGVTLDAGGEEAAFTLSRAGEDWTLSVPEDVTGIVPERLRPAAKFARIRASTLGAVGSVVLDASPSFVPMLQTGHVAAALDAAVALAVGTGSRSVRIHGSDGGGPLENLVVGPGFDSGSQLSRFAVALRERGLALDGGRPLPQIPVAADRSKATVLITDDVSAAVTATGEGAPLFILLVGDQPYPDTAAGVRVATVGAGVDARSVLGTLLER